jgi:MYXO-CTERM domain-containing protein
MALLRRVLGMRGWAKPVTPRHTRPRTSSLIVVRALLPSCSRASSSASRTDDGGPGPPPLLLLLLLFGTPKRRRPVMAVRVWRRLSLENVRRGKKKHPLIQSAPADAPWMGGLLLLLGRVDMYVWLTEPADSDFGGPTVTRRPTADSKEGASRGPFCGFLGPIWRFVSQGKRWK